MPPRPRPTAAGLPVALGLPVPDAAPAAPAPFPEAVSEAMPEAVPELVAPAEPETAAAPPAVRRNRMGGVVVPAAAPAPVAVSVEPVVPREQPTTPRPVLLRREDGERHPVPDEWLDERGLPFPAWYLTDAEMRELVDAAPPGRTCSETWPGCMSQICIIVRIGMDHTPYQDWCMGSRTTIHDTCYRKRGRA